MKNITNAINQVLETIVRSGKGWRILFALVLVASLFAVAPAQIAQAAAGGGKGHTFDVTLTKWAVTWPAYYPSLKGVEMVGVAGGAIGDGTFFGVVISDSSNPPYWYANARYEFYGEDESFVADVNVVQNNSTLSGVITGTITSGWLKGHHLTGEYIVEPSCTNPTVTPGNVFGTRCFQVTLHISTQ